MKVDLFNERTSVRATFPASPMVAAVAGIVLFSAASVMAEDYQVTFGVNPQGSAPGTGEFNTTKMIAWRSIGVSDGVVLTNKTSITVRAIKILVKSPGTDKFVHIAPNKGNELFAKVYIAPDGSGVIFNEGHGVDPADTMWSRVNPATPNDGTAKIFNGQVAEKDFDVPTGWKIAYSKVYSSSKSWHDLLAGLPVSKKGVDVYAEDAQRDTVCFVSHRELFVFDSKERKFHHVSWSGAARSPINRITLEKTDSGEAYVVWTNGERQGVVTMSNNRYELKPDEK